MNEDLLKELKNEVDKWQEIAYRYRLRLGMEISRGYYDKVDLHKKHPITWNQNNPSTCMSHLSEADQLANVDSEIMRSEIVHNNNKAEMVERVWDELTKDPDLEVSEQK